jgi:tetratricopeptide (TPR) repeat protein
MLRLATDLDFRDPQVAKMPKNRFFSSIAGETTMKSSLLSHCRIFFLMVFILPCLSALAQSHDASQPENALFQAAAAQWENQQWEQAVATYRQFVAQFPSHPLAAAAHFHIGSYLSYVAAPADAMVEYEKAIAQAPGSHAAHEAKIGIAALKYWLAEYAAAYELLRQVLRETDDWSLRKEVTFRMKEIGTLMALQQLPNQRSAMDCGPKALQEAFARLGLRAPDEILAHLFAMAGGATFAQLRDVTQATGLNAWGVQLQAEHLAAVPTPFIAHIGSKHYVVVTAITSDKVEYLDPHRGETYRTTEQFHRLWQGYALIVAPALPAELRSQLLTTAEMASIRGGHHLHGMNLGP